MTRILKLIERLAEAERAFASATFIAPALPGGTVRVRVEGIMQTFQIEPERFEGIGLFAPVDARSARLVREAGWTDARRYLALLPARRLILMERLARRSWSAMPIPPTRRPGDPDPAPAVVHLVDEGNRFDRVIARWDGGSFWFEELDRRDDPRLAERLRAELALGRDPGELRVAGLTPERRAAYALARFPGMLPASASPAQVERRLARALRIGGARLIGYTDRGDHWQVEWMTADDARHMSLVTKRDLSVVSAGICLSGRDGDFDLASLVGVVEERPEWM